MSPSLNLAHPELLQTTSFINGSFALPESERVLPVLNPYNGSVVANLHCVSPTGLDAALSSSSLALKEWRNTPTIERTAALDRLLSLMKQHADDLAKIIVAENGKPHKEALAEVAYAASFVAQVRAAAYTASHGTRCSEMSKDTLAMILREPVGVVLAVTPWNYPLGMITRKLAPALAAGCSVIAKPSEETPLATLALAELVNRAGFPPGVFGAIVTDESKEVCKTIMAHRDVRMVSFTGSTRVGRGLSEMAAARLQRTAMELGGLAPLIVCADADIPAAVDGLFRCKFKNAGQSCVSINRVYAHSSIADEFVSLIAARMKADIVLGHGTEAGSTIGPLINKAAVARVQAQIDNAVSLGARIVCQVPVPADEDTERFCPPTLLVDVPDNANCVRMETFGPLIAVQTFEDIGDAVRKANDTEAGLASYVYSSSLQTATSVARELESGCVGVNEITLSESRTCFGGVKQSGSGREGSEFQLEDYTEAKFVLLRHGAS